MKIKSIMACAAIAVGATLVTSCTGPAASSTSNTSSASNASSTGAGILGALAQTALGGNSSAVNTGSTIAGIIGQLTGSNIGSIEGTWVYSEPTVQFESENLLANAGGTMASQAIVKKIKPYYEKVGLKSGGLKLVFSSNNKCQYTIGGTTKEGTYQYNSSNHSLTITNAMGIRILNAYATISVNNLALTLDSSKLLTFIQGANLGTASTALSTISTLSQSYKGMKTGFLFVKK